jgi:hypothetical protein
LGDSVSQTKILIDPFLTRQQSAASEEWKTDEEAVLNVVAGADYIFAGHSHADHTGDIPFIAKRFGAKISGSRTTVNLSLSGGVDQARLTAISGGEKLDLKDFSVQVIKASTAYSLGTAENGNQVGGKYPARCQVRFSENISSRVEAISITSLGQTSPSAPKHRQLHRRESPRIRARQRHSSGSKRTIVVVPSRSPEPSKQFHGSKIPEIRNKTLGYIFFLKSPSSLKGVTENCYSPREGLIRPQEE